MIFRSFWTLSGSPGLLANRDLISIAEHAGCTAPQALFRIAQLQGITPLSGTTSEQHMKEDVGVKHIVFGDKLEKQIESVRGLVAGF